jgi:predicted HicB family RNase H-like nuclease
VDFEAGINNYLDRCQRKGIQPDKPYSGSLNIRIPSDIHNQIAMIAEKNGKSINAYICESLERRLESAIH